MNRFMILALTVAVLLSCSEWENDIYVEKPVSVEAGSGPAVSDDGQLYNMGFDLWSKDGNSPVCYGASASEEQKTVWGSANASTSSFGKSTCVPESSFIAVPGSGKCAVKLQTQMINAIFTKRLAAGSIFTGQMGKISLSKMMATLEWGIPFTFRPTALEGYACYKPEKIDYANAPYEDRMGTIDNGHVFVLLTDWDGQFTVDPATDTFVDIDNDPKIIGYGKVTFDHSMTEYEKFTINIDYRNERTPKYVVIVCSSSALGDYFTGGVGSTLYIDEFKFLY